MYTNYNSVKSKLLFRKTPKFTDGYTKIIELFCIYLVVSFVAVMFINTAYLNYWAIISFIISLWVMYTSFTNIQKLYFDNQRTIKELELLSVEAYLKGKALDGSPLEFDKYWNTKNVDKCPNYERSTSMEDLIKFCNKLEEKGMLTEEYYEDCKTNLKNAYEVTTETIETVKASE